MFTLAHLSDLHLGPLPRATSPRDYLSKRAIGYCSWSFRRQGFHKPAIATQVVTDIKASVPDHVALTGDLVNIALPLEFQMAARWLKDFGAPDWITVVPGNHDAYVPIAWDSGIGLWSDYMKGDLRSPGSITGTHIDTPYPFVRQRKNIAIIGTSSASPQGFRFANGSLGQRQLDDLAATLAMLRDRGFFRILLIHHPPFPGMAPARKALTDASQLKEVVEAEGAELILFGHNHHHLRTTISTRYGKAHALGVSSATASTGSSHPAAAWNKYAIRRLDGQWNTRVTVRSLSAASGQMETETEFDLVN